jgi:hypothetical protein
LEQSGLEMAPDKCKFWLFSKNKKTRSVTAITFLGLHFEASPNWNRHLDYIKLKCIRPLGIISYLC